MILHVNGEPVMTVGESKAKMSSTTQVKAVGSHPAGNIAGLTLFDYFSLPSMARIVVMIELAEPEGKAEGFITLRKL